MPSTADADPPWKTTLVRYDGYPMALRARPKADSEVHRRTFTRLLLVTHEFAHVKSNGLPEDDYNHSLARFDQAVQRFLEDAGDGLVALVETFAGKRTYYAYVDADSTFKGRYAKLRTEYPEHVLTIGHRMEPTWETYELYRRLFPW